MEDKVARGDDNHITSHDDSAQRHVSVLVHDSSNDVGTPCGTIVGKTESNACATKDGSQDTSHEGLLADELGQDIGVRIVRVRHFDDALHSPQHKGHGKDRIDGLHAEADAQFLNGDDKEDGIDDDVSDLHFDACHIVYDGRYASHPTCGEVVGQHEHGHSHCIKDYTRCDEGVIL